MSNITLTAAQTADAMLASMELNTETKTLANGSEQYRAIFRVTVTQDAYNVSDVGSPTADITTAASLSVRFNNTDLIEIEPLSDFEPFNLVGQHYTPMETKGSKFFRGTKEWVSVGQWTGLDWYNG